MIFTPSSTWPMNELVHVHVLSKIRIICIIDERSDTFLAKGMRKKAIMVVKTIAKACCFSQTYTWTGQGNKKKITSNDEILKNISSDNLPGFFF